MSKMPPCYFSHLLPTRSAATRRIGIDGSAPHPSSPAAAAARSPAPPPIPHAARLPHPAPCLNSSLRWWLHRAWIHQRIGRRPPQSLSSPASSLAGGRGTPASLCGDALPGRSPPCPCSWACGRAARVALATVPVAAIASMRGGAPPGPRGVERDAHRRR